jgi:hypothetical protein
MASHVECHTQCAALRPCAPCVSPSCVPRSQCQQRSLMVVHIQCLLLLGCVLRARYPRSAGVSSVLLERAYLRVHALERDTRCRSWWRNSCRAIPRTRLDARALELLIGAYVSEEIIERRRHRVVDRASIRRRASARAPHRFDSGDCASMHFSARGADPSIAG